MLIFGNVTLGAVGATDNLSTLTIGTTADTGKTTLNGNVTTTGTQTYNQAVNLGATATLDSSASSGDIHFANTVDATTAGAQNLTLTAGSGNVKLDGAVGSGMALGNLTVTAGLGTTTIGTATNLGSVTTAAGKTQTYNQAVVLGNDTSLTTSGAGAINLANTVNGNQALTVSAVKVRIFNIYVEVWLKVNVFPEVACN